MVLLTLIEFIITGDDGLLKYKVIFSISKTFVKNES